MVTPHSYQLKLGDIYIYIYIYIPTIRYQLRLGVMAYQVMQCNLSKTFCKKVLVFARVPKTLGRSSQGSSLLIGSPWPSMLISTCLGGVLKAERLAAIW